MTDHLDVGGVSLAFESHGAGEPDLVLVHGFTGAMLDWSDVMVPLSRSRRVLAYDQRGHGESTHTGDPASYTFDALTADLDGFVEATLGDDPFDLLGHSMGGVVALRWVLEHPGRVRSLVLMDTFSEPSGSLPAEVTEGLAKTGREQGMAAVAAIVRDFVTSTAQLDPIRAEEIAERVEWKMEHVDVEAFVAFARELASFPSMTDRLGEIACPTTVLVGERDPLRPAADVLAAGIAGSTLVVVPGAAHSPQEERTDAWLAAIEAHFTRC